MYEPFNKMLLSEARIYIIYNINPCLKKILEEKKEVGECFLKFI